jgi:hypothetical protein
VSAGAPVAVCTGVLPRRLRRQLGCSAWEDMPPRSHVERAACWAGPSGPWLVVADDGRSGHSGGTRSDVEASDVKDADVVCIRAIEK